MLLSQIISDSKYKQALSDILKIYIPEVMKLPIIREQSGFLKEQIKATNSDGVTDVATQADEHIESVLRSKINTIHPEWSFWGEEGEKSQSTDQLIVVDPIEGTNNFKTYRDEQWGSVIAFVEDDMPVIGVVAVPAQKKAFIGIKDCGALEVMFDESVDILQQSCVPMSLSPLNHEFTYNFSPHFELHITQQAQKFKHLGTVIGTEEGDNPIFSSRQILEIDGNKFIDPESGALEAVTNRGTIYFKTSAEMAAVFVIINELGGKVTDFSGANWHLGIDTMISARTAEDYNYLLSLVEKTKEVTV